MACFSGTGSATRSGAQSGEGFGGRGGNSFWFAEFQARLSSRSTVAALKRRHSASPAQREAKRKTRELRHLFRAHLNASSEQSSLFGEDAEEHRTFNAVFINNASVKV
ncbi:hypothetical protein MTO96_035766 [Rhipicephalus appendiculatus]